MLLIFILLWPEALAGGDVSSMVAKGLVTFRPSGTPSCTSAVERLHNAYANDKLWAVRMMEATTKGPSGVLFGNQFALGHYDECVQTVPTGEEWGARYTLARVSYEPTKTDLASPLVSKLLMNMSATATEVIAAKPVVRWIKKRDYVFIGLCVPNFCTEDDIEMSLESSIGSILKNAGFTTTVEVVRSVSHKGGSPPLASPLNPFIFIFLLFYLLVILGSCFHYFCIKDKTTTVQTVAEKVLYRFAYQTTLAKLRERKTSELEHISGMKVISMMIIIFGHRVMITFSQPMQNSQENELLFENILEHILLNGAMIVDTFFLVTGFLTFNKMLKDIDSGKEIHVLDCIKRRWLRLTPAYIFILMAVIFLVPELDTGPLGIDRLWDTRSCAKYSWTHILYINNYVSPHKQCLMPSWYLAVDMQLYVVCAVIAYFVSKHRTAGIVSLFTLLILSMVSQSLVVFVNNYWAVTLLYIGGLHDYFRDNEFLSTYVPTHTRATPYFIGMVAAWVYQKIKQSFESKLSEMVQIVLTFICSVGMLSAITASWYLSSPVYNPFYHIAYMVYRYVAWYSPIAWVIVMYATKNLHILNYFLVGRVYNFLNDLSYSTLLVHTPVQLYLATQFRYPIYFDLFFKIWMGAADIFICYCAGFVVYFIIEAPFSALLL